MNSSEITGMNGEMCFHSMEEDGLKDWKNKRMKLKYSKNFLALSSLQQSGWEAGSCSQVGEIQIN